MSVTAILALKAFCIRGISAENISRRKSLITYSSNDLMNVSRWNTTGLDKTVVVSISLFLSEEI